jgi:hypothetical protein
MPEHIYFNQDNEVQVILQYPGTGPEGGRVDEIIYINTVSSLFLLTELFPGGSLNAFKEEIIATPARVLSALPFGLKQQIIVDDSNPDEVVVSGFEFKAQTVKIRPNPGGYLG